MCVRARALFILYMTPIDRVRSCKVFCERHIQMHFANNMHSLLYLNIGFPPKNWCNSYARIYLFVAVVFGWREFDMWPSDRGCIPPGLHALSLLVKNDWNTEMDFMEIIFVGHKWSRVNLVNRLIYYDVGRLCAKARDGSFAGGVLFVGQCDNTTR